MKSMIQPIETASASILMPFNELSKIAEAIAKSGLFGVKEPAQAIALCLIAQAEGRHPASAAMDYHVIQNRPSLKADTILARFLAAGGKVEWHRLDRECADATFSHPQGGTVRIDWHLADAKKIMFEEWVDLPNGKRGKQPRPLTTKENWLNYPRAMLRARCISEGCRTVYPGATSGMYTPEEVRDMTPEREINGTVVEMHRNAPEPPPDPPIGAGSNAHKALEARIGELGLDREGVKTWCARHYRVEHFPDLTASQQRDLMTRLPGFAVQKILRQIPMMGIPDLESLIATPPEWLKWMTQMDTVMEAADKRLTALQAAPAAPAPESTDPTFGGDFQEQIAG